MTGLMHVGVSVALVAAAGVVGAWAGVLVRGGWPWWLAFLAGVFASGAWTYQVKFTTLPLMVASVLFDVVVALSWALTLTALGDARFGFWQWMGVVVSTAGLVMLSSGQEGSVVP